MTDIPFDATPHIANREAANREARARLEHLAWIMDSALRIPGTRMRIGADSLLGFIPGIGNLATSAVSAYLIREAWRLGVPRRTIGRMAANVAIDAALTSVPILGNFADIFWKANRRNMAILADHLGPA